MNDDVSPISGLSIFRKLCFINPAKAQGPTVSPDGKNAEFWMPPIMDVMNTSFREGRLPLSRKEANIVPVPKQRPVQDTNKHFCFISHTPILSNSFNIHPTLFPLVSNFVTIRAATRDHHTHHRLRL